MPQTSNTSTRSHNQEYRHFAGKFQEQFSGIVHRDLKLERLIRVGVAGQPVIDSLPYVFWQPEYILHTEAHRQADRLMPELYRTFLRKGERLIMDELDQQVLIGLALYAVWRFRDEWLYSLSDLVRLGYLGGPEAETILKFCSILSALTGQKKRAHVLRNLIPGIDPFYDFIYDLLGGKTNLASENSRAPQLEDEQLPGVKRLLWFNAALEGDDELEKYLLRRMTKNPPTDENDLLDMYAALLARGKLFRAQRLLLRHCGLLGEKAHILNLVLHHYILNGKYLAFLRRLSAMQGLAGQLNWYRSAFALQQLQINDGSAVLSQMMQKKETSQLPEDEQSMYRFEEVLQSLQTDGRPPQFRNKSMRDMVMVAYLSPSNHPALLRESYTAFQGLIEIPLRDGQPMEIERIALYFPVLFQKMRLYGRRGLRGRLWPVLQSLAGRSLSVRLFLGLEASRRGYHAIADKFLYRQSSSQDEVLHIQAESAMQSNRETEAQKIYQRLLARSGYNALYHYNYGLLLEKMGKRRDALHAFQACLDREPGFLAARDMIELLR